MTSVTPPKLMLSGAFIDKLMKLYPNQREAAARFDHLIGYQRAPAVSGPAEAKAPLAIAEPGFRQLEAVAKNGPAQPMLGGL